MSRRGERDGEKNIAPTEAKSVRWAGKKKDLIRFCWVSPVSFIYTLCCLNRPGSFLRTFLSVSMTISSLYEASNSLRAHCRYLVKSSGPKSSSDSPLSLLWSLMFQWSPCLVSLHSGYQLKKQEDIFHLFIIYVKSQYVKRNPHMRP